MNNYLVDTKKRLVISKNLMMIEKCIIDEIESKASCINKRYVSPMITKKNQVLEHGVSLNGLKNIFTSIGYNYNEVCDLLDKYDKPFIFLNNENGKITSFIDYDSLYEIIEYCLDLLDRDRKLSNEKNIICMINELFIRKVDYITSTIKNINNYKSIKQRCIDVVREYNANNGLFYGNQQYLIRKEICNLLDKEMPFGSCLKELGLTYKWLDNAPYFCTHGKEWLVCKINL